MQQGVDPRLDRVRLSSFPSQQWGHPTMQRTRSRPKVLVVDDEAEVLQSVHDLLRIDYQVLTCQSGADALDHLRAAPDITVLLTDQRMPGMSGVEVLQQAQVIRPETTRLLFTAFADIHAVIDAINQGHVFRYITKPWEPEELESVIRQAVERHDLIAERNRLIAELQATNAKLEETNRLKNAFLEVASHELNTPVTVVLGLTDLWKMSLEDSASASGPQRVWVERISAAAQRLAKTVGRMLKLLENRELGQKLNLEQVELEPIIGQAVEELSPYLEARKQHVAVHVEPKIGPVEADSSKLLDILINLVANAIKFTPDQGTIQVEAQAVPGNPNWVRVVIQDQGVGVRPGELQHLFEPFFTGFDTLHHSSGDFQFGKRGIGLGLCLVKRFVELHGGRVEVLSVPDQGSSFGFILPRRQPHAEGNGRDQKPRIEAGSEGSSLPCTSTSVWLKGSGGIGGL
ncbi:MAG: ATP-binding protein [Isosphaeraceae bacterium]